MTTDAAATPAAAYPVRLSVDYPEGPRNRLTALVRPILIIPIVVVLMLLSGGGGGREYRDGAWGGPARRFRAGAAAG